MYYKGLKNNRVIDVLDNLIYLKWQDKHKTMILSDENEAQAILSSFPFLFVSSINVINSPKILEILPADFVVELVEIDEYEYKQLKMLNGKTTDEILDAYTLLLIDEGVI